jgi:hypothetical protein
MSSHKSIIVCAFALSAATFSLPGVGRADLILGVLNTTGTAEVSFGSIAFVGSEMTINSPGASQQGDFTALEGTTATIDDITNPPDATGPITPAQTDFITFAAAPDISITFTFLMPGIDGAAGCTATPPAPGQVCTPDSPDQSPFNLQNTSATSSSASFNILGLEVDSATGDTVPITGAFTTPFSSQTFQDLLAAIADKQTITTSFSAQFATVSPEPGTLSDLMIVFPGLLAFAWLCRRKIVNS